MSGTKRGKLGVSTGGVEKSPARRKREAKRRAAEERNWAAKNGPVKSVTLPTPIGSAKERECIGDPYQGMRSGECAAEATYVVAGDLPAGLVLAGVCDQHFSSVLEAFREYGKEEPTVQAVSAFLQERDEENAAPAPKFRDSVSDAS